ncbi:bifunctional riboflavin kinase/FAD synthetase [Arcobacter sp. FWKO B]|uniref:bifunctional riboflavin kinase/FAD synthetase n=1 Tax=Arcobacter sp. FWKO B TaxID=2593672 RepID=UPI0018A5B3F9|nr:bifunctional riboflavin kinase/FAD synthetase [Arcobacter sp. FWKO B]QOG11850.1 bifunctional riboflavin kinase/FAD synthetase [Arcobacter sp. FWKO B]
MKSFTTSKNSITSLAIGGFDGMHIAHQKLFSYLDNNGAIVAIETGYANLTPKSNRQKYVNFPVFYYPLDEIKHLSGKEFVSLLREEFPNLKKIVVGYDFCFGKNRMYNTSSLKELFDGEVIVVDEVTFETVAIHSRTIREFLRDGNIKQANKFLGKVYTISGYVIKGQGIGKEQFVPTINIEVLDFLIPKEGIYATKTLVNNTLYNSVSFIGHRLSTDGNFAIETHIIDKDLNFDGGVVEVQFFDKLRDNQKYENLDELKKQILLDIDNARSYFAR